MERVALIGLLLAPLATGCSPEVLVRVEAEAGVRADRLRVEVFRFDAPTPAARVQTDPLEGELPQTFLVEPEDGEGGGWIRVRVTALLDGAARAAGDVAVELPSSGRAEATVTLTPGCETVQCPALERCDPTTLRCDRNCAGDASCDTFGLCALSPLCLGGRCQAGSTDDPTRANDDLDADGVSDGICPYNVGGPDCDDGDPTVPVARTPPCNGSLDRDCDGLPDERTDCAACIGGVAPATSTMFTVGAPVVGLAALRPVGGELAVLVATADGVALVDVASGTVRASASLAPTRDVSVVGDLVAAATEGGLVLLRIDDDGALHAGPLYDHHGALSDLIAVDLAGAVAYVTGPRVGLAAVDVSRPDAPRLLRASSDEGGAEVVAGGGASCLLRDGISCYRTPPVGTDFGAIGLPSIGGAAAIAMSVGGAAPRLLVAADGELQVHELDSAMGQSRLFAMGPGPATALQPLGAALVSVDATGSVTRHAGFTGAAALADIERAPQSAAGTGEVSAVITGFDGAERVAVARGATVTVYTFGCR